MDKRVRQASDFIKKNYKKDLSVKELAQNAGMSLFHFHRLFKEEIGITPKEFLIEVRLSRANVLIRIDPKMSKTQIALESGYTSLGTFSKAFIKRFGVSPTGIIKTQGASFIEDSTKKKLLVEVVHFPGTRILYSMVSIKEDSLLASFASTRFMGESLGFKLLSNKNFGFLTQTVFHGPRDESNYYTGVEVDASSAAHGHRLFKIPEGKYARFETDFACNDPWGLLTQFVTEWLKISPFVFRDIFAFEEILPGNQLSDYPHFRRVVYYPIRQK